MYILLCVLHLCVIKKEDNNDTNNKDAVVSILWMIKHECLEQRTENEFRSGLMAAYIPILYS